MSVQKLIQELSQQLTIAESDQCCVGMQEAARNAIRFLSDLSDIAGGVPPCGHTVTQEYADRLSDEFARLTVHIGQLEVERRQVRARLDAMGKLEFDVEYRDC